LKPHNIKQPMKNRVIWQRLLRGLGFVQHKAAVGYSRDCSLIYSAQCFFYFFYFLFFFVVVKTAFFIFFRSRINCFFYFFVVVKTVFLFFAVVLLVKTAACHPLSIFAQIYYFLSIFARNLIKYRLKVQ
jgi:hypothetical protein